jgi:hypothetical protein
MSDECAAFLAREVGDERCKADGAAPRPRAHCHTSSTCWAMRTHLADMVLSVGTATLLVVGSACANDTDAERQPPTDHRASQLPPAPAAAQSAASVVDSSQTSLARQAPSTEAGVPGGSGLLDRVRHLRGSYVTRGDQEAFRGDQTLFRWLAEHGDDSAVKTLVGCFDRSEPAAATRGGKPVAMGVMCYEALTHTASYEATDRTGDLHPDWPGYLLPSASPRDLTRAKNAWADVVARKAYSLTSKS